MKINYLEKLSIKDDQAESSEIRARIDSSSRVTGTNMYILIFAILIACIGLNADSTAVVIGAMLISPLMGNIISISYGIANRDSAWTKKSVRAFLFQIGVSIITSTIYFSLSPITTFSGELVARTEPSVLDVLIAIFGGSAAIIANTRKNLISNVIPGTAIATALMPPLCTVGYCISAHNWTAVLSSAYLFTINTIFICISALVGLHLMHLTSAKDLLRDRKSRIMIAAVVVAAMVPSFFLAWNTFRDVKLEDSFDSFVENEFDFDQTHVVMSDINEAEKNIEITLVGLLLDDSQIRDIEKRMSGYELQDYSLAVIQTSTDGGISKEDLDKILADNERNGNGGLGSAATSEEKEAVIALNIINADRETSREFLKELQILYPDVDTCGFSAMRNSDGKTVKTLVIVADKAISKSDQTRIRAWVKEKLDTDVEIMQIIK